MRSWPRSRSTMFDAQAPFPRVGGDRHSLDADPLAVFAELRDPSLWFPLMRRSVWHTGATSGVGAEREVDIRLLRPVPRAHARVGARASASRSR